MSTIDLAPLHTDERAIKAKEYIDYNNKVSIQDAEAGNVSRPIRIYADGVYDMFHHGHARQLMQAKKIFSKCDTYLIVGVCGDAVVRAKKGETLMIEEERYESVRHCRYVDCVIDNAPWIVDEEFLKHHKIDFVAHDALPYSSDSSNDIYDNLKKKKMFVATNRTDGISTSDIMTRILNKYDIYIERNLKRGYTREQLNFGHIREAFLKISKFLENFENKMRRFASVNVLNKYNKFD